MRTTTASAFATLLGGTALAVAETTHTGQEGSMDHSSHMRGEMEATAQLTEPGQGAFAALAEVVRVLEADPATDWSRVNLAGLRVHLVDMDRLISSAVVTEANLPDGVSAIATGDVATLDTLRRMVPTHARQLAYDDWWTVITADTADGVELRVTSDDPAVVARIQGLGFFGLMASQDHHREHHLMMARGEDAHEH